MKKYPIVKKSSYLKYIILCGFVLLAISVINIILAIKTFPEILPEHRLIIELLILVVAGIVLACLIKGIADRKITLWRVGYDEAGIHIFDYDGSEKRFYAWSSVSDCGIHVCRDDGHVSHRDCLADGILQFLYFGILEKDFGKFIFFSREPLGESEIMRLSDLKIKDGLLCIECDEESLCDIRKYCPSFSAKER